MKDFLIIGCGRFGGSVADALINMRKNVAIMDTNEKIVQQMSDKVTFAIQGDATDQNNLTSIGLQNYDVIVVAIGTDLESSIMVTINLKISGAKHVIVKAQSDAHAKVLERIGADRIIFPERDMGMRTAYNLTATNLLDYIELSPEYSIMEIIALSEWKGKTLENLNFSSRYKVNVVAIKSGNAVKLALSADDIITENDILVVVGHNKDLKKIQK